MGRMKIPRFLHYLILLLAVWLPLDNAVAGAVIADCPMMSHAFEQGLQATVDPAAAHHQITPALHSMVSVMQHHSISDQSDGCCDHCAVCLLLGTVALPGAPNAMPLSVGYVTYQTAADTHAPVGIATHPFRPPII